MFCEWDIMPASNFKLSLICNRFRLFIQNMSFLTIRILVPQIVWSCLDFFYIWFILFSPTASNNDRDRTRNFFIRIKNKLFCIHFVFILAPTTTIYFWAYPLGCIALLPIFVGVWTLPLAGFHFIFTSIESLSIRILT